MRFSRSDYHEMIGNDVIAEYRENLQNQSKHINIKDLIANKFRDPKLAVSAYLDNFQERTGLKYYLNQINSELSKANLKHYLNQINAALVEVDNNNNISSILDISDIKNSVDLALARKEFSRSVDLLNKLQDVVMHDDRIPNDMKNVMMDSKLIEYIKSKMDINNKDVDYNYILNKKENNEESDQQNATYFNFNSKEDFT